jgi:hypothetical protein
MFHKELQKMKIIPETQSERHSKRKMAETGTED